MYLSSLFKVKTQAFVMLQILKEHNHQILYEHCLKDIFRVLSITFFKHLVIMILKYFKHEKGTEFIFLSHVDLSLYCSYTILPSKPDHQICREKTQPASLNSGNTFMSSCVHFKTTLIFETVFVICHDNILSIRFHVYIFACTLVKTKLKHTI